MSDETEMLNILGNGTDSPRQAATVGLEGSQGLTVPIHLRVLRHACGYKLANDGHDTRAIQHYLGHKNIQHTVRYTEMAPDRFKNFWRD
jgi:site-specific recombinase XerD